MTKELEIVSTLHSSPREGLELLFNVFGSKLLAYAIENWKFDEDDAWECIYKTFQTIVDTIEDYDFTTDAHFKNFLFKVFKNNLRQVYKKQKALIQKIEFVPLSEALAFTTTEQDNLMYSDGESFFEALANDKSFRTDNRLKMIETALDKLEEDERELLLLRGQNFSYKEIGALMGIQDDHLKVRVHRAKKKLLKIINELQNSYHGQE